MGDVDENYLKALILSGCAHTLHNPQYLYSLTSNLYPTAELGILNFISFRMTVNLKTGSAVMCILLIQGTRFGLLTPISSSTYPPMIPAQADLISSSGLSVYLLLTCGTHTRTKKHA